MTTKRDDGGPAFPIKSECAGMTLRDWFAGQAATSMVTQINYLVGYTDDRLLDWQVERIARGAYAIADAMLRERGEA